VKLDRRAPFALLLLTALGSQPALASKELATKNGCAGCHAPDRKVLGPSYADVAKKYAGQKDAVALLAESIRKGGQGKWGPVPMPAQPALSDADLKTLAAWVLAGGK
jgi:cytochrome c